MCRVPRLPLLSLAALLLAVSACGSGERVAPESAASPHTRTDGQRQESDAATPRATPATPDPSPSAHQPAQKQAQKPARKPKGHKPPVVMGQPLHRPALTTHLLTADRMPSADAETAWEVADDGPEGAIAVGACQKTDLTTIGALSAVRRSFAAADGAVATQVVAAFADPKSAWRAHEVLRSWQADCAERLDFARTEIGPLRPVAVRAGDGESYRAAYGRSARRGWATGLGIVRRGSYLSVVEILTARADYPAERDPSRRAVRRIARTFA